MDDIIMSLSFEDLLLNDICLMSFLELNSLVNYKNVAEIVPTYKNDIQNILRKFFCEDGLLVVFIQKLLSGDEYQSIKTVYANEKCY